MNFGILIGLFGLSFLMTYVVRKFALKYSIMDKPNDRSSHAVPIPRGGGVAVVISWFIGITYFFWKNLISADLFFALLSGIPLVIIGFLDDIVSIRPIIRFFTQLIVASLAIYFLGGERIIDFGFFKLTNVWLFTPLALIGVIWFTNLFNFLDGIDGYIGSEVVYIGAASYLLFANTLGLLLVAVTLGFLVWNWQKAKIFMGDVGSTLLGFTIAVIVIYYQNNLISSLPVWLILTSLFWVDATVTLFRRIKNKEDLSHAHRKHAYQRIVQAGFSHQKTVIWALALNIVGFGLAWLATEFKTYALAFLVIDLLLLFLVLKWIDKKKPFEYKLQY